MGISLKSRELPLFLLSLSIGVCMAEYYVNIPVITVASTTLQEWTIILSIFAAIIGMISLIRHNIRTIQSRKPYWWLYIYMFIVAIITSVLGLIYPFATNVTYGWIMSNIYMPIDASIASMLAFDISYAFYRTFRARTIDSGILLVCALLLMFKSAPLGPVVFPPLLPVANWVFDYLGAGGSRGFAIVASIGLLAYTIRIFLGHDRASIGIEA